MRVISTLGFKGGISKSTLATTLAYVMSCWGQRVLLIDCDIQANASTLVEASDGPTLTGVLRGQARLREAIVAVRPNLDLVPSDRNLDTAAKHITAEGRRAYYILKRELSTVADYDLVILDHSPSYSAVTEAGLLASTEMIIPCQLAPFSVDGLVTMFDKLEDVLVEHTLTLTGIVPSMVDGRLSMHRAYREELEQTFAGKVLPSVRTDSAVPKAQSFHMTVVEFDPESRASQDYRAVAAAVLAQKVDAA